MRCHQSRWQPTRGRNPLSESPETVQTNRASSLNLLHRLIDGKVSGGPDIATPQALMLRREPKADVERYDGLRVRIAGGRHAS